MVVLMAIVTAASCRAVAVLLWPQLGSRACVAEWVILNKLPDLIWGIVHRCSPRNLDALAILALCIANAQMHCLFL